VQSPGYGCAPEDASTKLSLETAAVLEASFGEGRRIFLGSSFEDCYQRQIFRMDS